ncbi:MAG TPA: bi-domain-containing oxidoreductase [Gemmataceae bacterium]|nr:bi-domain-containing oxidoreductase [Gemmataceae bacterium]
MRQILVKDTGALVARVPRPALEPGTVLVRVHYSLISVGTEVASLRPAWAALAGATPAERIVSCSSVARQYLSKALRDPGKALRKVVQLGCQVARSTVRRTFPPLPPRAAAQVTEVRWSRCSAREWHCSDGWLQLVTDDSPAGYQAMSQPVPVPAGRVPVVELAGEVEHGAVLIGLVNEDGSRWLGSRRYETGPLDDQLIVPAGDSHSVTLVVANVEGGAGSRVKLDGVRIVARPATESGLPLSELDDQGWNVGYSAAGEVLAVGDGVTEFVPGDWVACAGAGQANHADFIRVKKNLVCRIPQGCSLRAAATTTVGAIALQGVRRAGVQLGETAAVLGLGLIGQITVQLLNAAGCRVLGLDLDAGRVERARSLGLHDGAADAETFQRLVRDWTGGRGADCTLITAATKTSTVINLAMEITRAKGTVVVVGDVGLNVERAAFYRKEIDLRMSTSYGPGRYDPAYEEDGLDYPFAYVRWTLNRNMQAYLELIAAGRVNVEALIDRTVPIDEAPAVYRELAAARGPLPLGVLLHYPDDPRPLPEAADATRITIRGHRPVPSGRIRYALVGVGAFGTSMLVPAMDRRKDRFFLRGVVSRNAAQGGNFARSRQVETFTSELDDVLNDPGFDLVVIATRHHEHAGQVVRSLRAGKHVFVEKPLALSWRELDEVVRTYHSLAEPPLLMVGFNRRFAPAVRLLKEILNRRRSPLVINYRLHGGYLPLDHWVQGPQGGGRNLGEACHIYDLFRFLSDAPVAGVQASAIDPGPLPYRRNDNFCATLNYDDGSLATLVYTALGPKTGLSKERMEVFCDGEAYVLDDFRSLVRAGDGKVLWSAAEPDKGHLEELSRFGDALVEGGPAPIPFAQLAETTAVALHIEDLLHKRNPDEDPTS